MESRQDRLMPAGAPRYVHCYDNGGRSYDRYTVVFTGRYRHKTGGVFWYLGMNESPFHPQGFGQSGESEHQIDYPTYGHLGKKVTWASLPADCQKAALSMYEDLWDLR